MKLAIMQPYLFPYIGYFQLINSVDKFILLDDVNFIKKGWINRNKILFSYNVHTFSVPLKKITQNKKINEIKIIDDNKWRNKFLLTLKHAYSKANHFDNVFPLIKECMEIRAENISKFNFECLKKLCKYLNIDTELINSSAKYETEELKGKDKLIKICKYENADTYINSIGGMALYQKEDFNKNGVDLLFLKPNLIPYKQLSNEFIPGLSIIDLLMNNGNINRFINNYELI